MRPPNLFKITIHWWPAKWKILWQMAKHAVAWQEVLPCLCWRLYRQDFKWCEQFTFTWPNLVFACVVAGQAWCGGVASLTSKADVVRWQACCGSLASWCGLLWWCGKPGKAFLHKTTICCLSSGNTLGSVSDWQETDGNVSVHSSKCWFSRRGSVQKRKNKNPFHKTNMFQCRWSQKRFAQSQKCKTFVTQPSLHRVTTAWWC